MVFLCCAFLCFLPIIIMGCLILSAFAIIPLALFIFTLLYLKIKKGKSQRRQRDGANVAFFHPYCNAGGVGERVLWGAIKAILTRYPDSSIYIYTVETAEPETILDKVQNQFNVKVDPEKINFVRLGMQKLIEAKSNCTLQSLGSMVLGMVAFMKLSPDIFIDTTGFAFTYPIFRYLAQCPVACYVHYPTITSAMMERVTHRNPLCKWLKLIYYKIFSWFYGAAGRCADVVMVNSGWMEEQISEMWRLQHSIHRVYPTCEVTELKQLQSLVKESDPIHILSVAQFRPEEDHPLMLQVMYELRNLLVKDEMLWNKIKLVLAGSCRNPEDEERVRNVKNLAKRLALEDNIQFEVNAPYTRLLQLYQTSTIAIHAMWNEHFDISVVESMAAGLITIARRSGGPLLDMIQDSPVRTGFLAAEPEEYARAVLKVLALPTDDRRKIVEAARDSVDRFSEMEFEKSFLRAAESLFIIN